MEFDFYKNQRCLIFDESGNLGASGRYFVIACIDTMNYKGLQNTIKRKLGVAKQMFAELAAMHANEIKAKEAYPCIKYHIAEVIAKKDLTISYIVADLHHVKPSLLEDNNIFYNYMMKLLIVRLVSKKDNGTKLNIICDNHTTRIGSANTFSEYIKLELLYERGLDIELNIELMDSDDKSAYPVQAADYIANFLYGNFEYQHNEYFGVIAEKLNVSEHFPYKKFGK